MFNGITNLLTTANDSHATFPRHHKEVNSHKAVQRRKIDWGNPFEAASKNSRNGGHRGILRIFGGVYHNSLKAFNIGVFSFRA